MHFRLLYTSESLLLAILKTNCSMFFGDQVYAIYEKMKLVYTYRRGPKLGFPGLVYTYCRSRVLYHVDMRPHVYTYCCARVLYHVYTRCCSRVLYPCVYPLPYINLMLKYIKLDENTSRYVKYTLEYTLRGSPKRLPEPPEPKSVQNKHSRI